MAHAPRSRWAGPGMRGRIAGDASLQKAHDGLDDGGARGHPERREGTMFVRRLDETLRNERGGQVSHLLMAKGDFGSANLGITWVTGSPGSEQPTDAHQGSEQVYVIVSGHG